QTNGIYIYFISISGLAAPFIEDCPHDSKLDEDHCICNPESCVKPPCLTELEVHKKGTDEPGSCCPIYSCIGCKNETLLEGKCPCAPGAVLNEKGICKCIDKERHLVNGECVCNPQQCELPKICDRKSLLTTIEDGCCRKTRCVPCPQDSESTNLDTDELEDHCVCLPCMNDCGFNKTVVVKKKGTGFPGNCCDLYECKPIVDEKDKDCVVGDIIYENGEEWSTDDKQQCRCKNGISLCAKKAEEAVLQNCFDEAVMYKHNETWLKDRGCTFCTCLNGEPVCISHYCDVKESQIKENNSAPCFRDTKMFAHLHSWTEENECEEKCNSKPCGEKEISNIGECLPLINCNKPCPNGLRLNKLGCEICKCKPARVKSELLSKYNITYSELLNLLEDYSKSKTAATSTSIISTIITTTLATSTEKNSAMPTVLIIRRDGTDDKNSGTMITPAFSPKDGSTCWITLSILVVFILVIVVIGIIFCFYKNKKKYSVTPSRGSYHSVLSPTSENNNTIKKDSIRFDNE
ncbi:hypothetical protein HUJ05_004484, partial [Dendroctonus ponderosae]